MLKYFQGHNYTSREFPGGPVVRTQRFHCQGRVRSLVWELRSHKPCGAAKKKKKRKKKKKEKCEKKSYTSKHIASTILFPFIII